MFKAKVFSVEEKEWDKLVRKSLYCDIHFLQGFMKILGKHIGSKPQLYFFGSKKKYVLYPFFKRKIEINNADMQEEFYDIVSPWYYGGYLFFGRISQDFLNQFLKNFSCYCKKEKIVSEFCRFNPYLSYAVVTNGIKLKPQGVVVGVDLSKSIQGIFSGFSSSTRREIRNNTKEGVQIICDNNDQMIKKFFNLYADSMRSKNAKQFYFFSENFFWGLRDYFKDNFILITGLKKGKVLSSFLFLLENGRMYYLLSGRATGEKTGPAVKSTIFEAIKIGKEKNALVLDLGGEYSGGKLLDFKTHFSKKFFVRMDYRKIHDLETYTTLCTLANIKSGNLKYENADFFPEYSVNSFT